MSKLKRCSTFKPKSSSTKTKCPELLTGKNSVIPCTAPNTNACQSSIENKKATLQYRKKSAFLSISIGWSFLMYFITIHIVKSPIHFGRMQKKKTLALLTAAIKTDQPLSTCSALPMITQIVKRIPKHGVEAFLVTPKDIPFMQKKQTWYGWIPLRSGKKWKRVPIQKPQMVYARTILRNSKHAKLIKDLRDYMDDEKIIRFHDRRFTGLTHDKYRFYKWLSKEKKVQDYLPFTILLHDSNEKIKKFLSQNEEFILKPNKGGKGIGVTHVFKKNKQWFYSVPIKGEKQNGTITPPSLKGIHQYLQKLDLPYQEYLLQKKIHSLLYRDQVFDLRLVYQKKSIDTPLQFVGITARIGQNGSIVSNISTGGKAMKAEKFLKLLFPKDARSQKKMLKDAKKLGDDITKCVDQDFETQEFSLDIMIDTDHKLWIIEANAKPAAYAIFSLAGSKREADKVIRNVCT